jgi:uncharacterized protein (TIGR02598 family)
MKRGAELSQAFSLVEVTLALGVAGFCLIAILSLLPVGVLTNRNATSETAATAILAAVIADMRATSTTSTTSPQFGITFGTATTLYFDGDGQAANSIDPAFPTPFQPRYRLSVSFPQIGGLTYADVKVAWPAAASPTNTSGSVEMFAAFDRN